jgi:hypothetical protein
MSQIILNDSNITDILTVPNINLPSSTEDLKQLLIEINNKRYFCQRQSDVQDTSIQKNDLSLNNTEFSVDQSVLNSIFSKNEKDNKLLINDYLNNNDKKNFDNKNIINLINVDQAIFENNDKSKIQIINNMNNNIDTFEQEEKSVNSVSNEKSSKLEEINFINIDKTFMENNEKSITIIQNVPLLIINHTCYANESCSFKEDSLSKTRLSKSDSESISTHNLEDEYGKNITATSDRLKNSRFKDTPNSFDNTYSATSYMHYDEILPFDSIDQKTMSENIIIDVEDVSKSSSIHLGEKHDSLIINDEEKHNSLSINEDEKHDSLNINEEDKHDSSTITDIKSEELIKELSNDKNQIDDSYLSNKSQNKFDSKLSEEDLSEQTNDSEKLKNSKLQENLKANKSIKEKNRKQCDESNESEYSLIKIKPQRKKKSCDEIDDCEKTLIDGIDKIKRILSQYEKAPSNNIIQPNQNIYINKEKRQKPCFDKLEKNPSIKFIFPYLNLGNETMPVENNKIGNNTKKANFPKLPYESKVCPKGKFVCNTSENQTPVWVLTRVTKHLTKTIKKEYICC